MLEPKITYKYGRHEIAEFTGRWKVINKELFVEVRYILVMVSIMAIRKVIETTFAISGSITWDEEWPIMGG